MNRGTDTYMNKRILYASYKEGVEFNVRNVLLCSNLKPYKKNDDLYRLRLSTNAVYIFPVTPPIYTRIFVSRKLKKKKII